MDAISFVLGIKSSHLRSTQLRDLVYRGRVLKHSTINADGTATDGPEGATNGHTNGDAGSDNETSTQTASQRNDPQTAWVMAVYEDEAGDEQKWKRSITATGQSEYRINNRVVTAKQYNDQLESENILIKARNFLVFQGDVEAIASQSSKDLTRLVEQISGSLEHKDDYERLKVEFEKSTDDHAFRLNQRRAMNSEIKQYQEQKREAENFERRTAERDNAIVTHILWKLYHLQQQIEESGAEIQKHQEELKEHRRNVDSYEKKFDDAKREQAKISREFSKAERTIKQKEREIENQTSELVPIDVKLEETERNQSKVHDRVDEVKKESQKHTTSIEGLKKSLATVEKAQKRWEEEWNKTAQKHGKQLSTADLQEYNKLRGEVAKKTAGDQMEADKIKRQLKTDEETANSMKSRIEASEAQIQKYQDELKGLTDRKNDLTSELKQAQKDHETKKKALSQLSSERITTTQKQTELEEKLHDVLQKLSDAETGRRESDKEARTRETVAALKRIYPGVRGRLHELCKPKQKKYETAVGIVLGRHWDSVVVDTEAVAKDCIQYLRDQRAGQGTFIPLDSIQVKPVNPNLKSVHKGARLGLDCIDYNSSVERAMTYACGTTLVCDDIKIAKYVCFEKHVDVSAVTLDGIKISKGGLMTGGRGAHEKKRRWDDAEIEKLRQLRDKFMSDLSQLASSNTGHRRDQQEVVLQGDLSGLDQKLDYFRAELKSIERNIQDRKKELDFNKNQVKDASPRYDQQAKRVETLNGRLKGHEGFIGQTEDKVFSAFCKKHGYANIRDYEVQQGSLQEEALKKKLEFSNQKNRLQTSLDYENGLIEKTEDRLTRLQGNLKDHSRTISEWTSKKEEIQRGLDRFRKEVGRLIDQLDTLKDDVNGKAEKVVETRRELQKHSKVIDDTLKEVAEVEANVQRDNSARFNLLRRCRLDEIKIPLEEDSEPLSALPLNDVQGTDLDEMEVDDELDRQIEQVHDYGIVLNFESLDDDLKEDDSTKQEDQLKQDIVTLDNELDKMAPNMKATDRLEGVESRLKTTEKDLETARRDAKRARDDFEEVKERRLELFNKAFNHISEQIGTVYKDLTKSAQTPLGGQA